MTRRRKKLLDTQLRKKNKDRFSQLPDSLIQHVLSFIPTKCAVSTTVLSKRWMNLWMHVPTLDLSFFKGKTDEEYLEEEETNRFMVFSDRVLLLRNMSNILTFRLICDNHYFDINRVKEWIATVLKSKVQEVILSTRFPEPEDMFPVGLFTCESLIKLDINFSLDHDYESCILNLPQSISFPRLKVLLLSGIIFQDEILVEQLFSNCPILEDLHLYDCSWDEMNVISISDPTLKSFTLINRNWTGGIDSAELKIDALNLMSIKYRDYLPLNLVVDNFPSVVE